MYPKRTVLQAAAAVAVIVACRTAILGSRSAQRDAPEARMGAAQGTVVVVR